jgi:peptidoglycan/xylan/chitin deacetylase (PgdA/CDA1 family)
MHRRDFLKFATFSAALSVIGRWAGFAAVTAPGSFPVYLTFDDGPTTQRDLSGPTTSVLDTLRAEQVPATFFLHGRAINGWEGPILVRMLADGHSIGNHLWQQGLNTAREHPSLPLLAKQYIITEERIRSILQATDEAALAKYLAQPKLFRRPGGSNQLSGFLDPRNFEALAHAPYVWPYRDKLKWLNGVYDYSGWHVNGGDGITDLRIQPTTAAKMVTWIMKGGSGYPGVDSFLRAGIPPRRSIEAEAGLIILLHDADRVTDDALPEVIRQLRLRGAQFHALPRPQDRPNSRTVGIGYQPTPGPPDQSQATA